MLDRGLIWAACLAAPCVLPCLGVSFPSILVLELGLAMDATAVAAARGLAAPVVRPLHAVVVGALFGAAQGLMPLLGRALGARLGRFVVAWDHWIAFLLLVALGAKMLWEARGDQKSTPPRGNPFALRILLVLALATSVDAFAVGVTLPMMGAPLLLSVVTIGVTTAVLSGTAVLVGRRFSRGAGRRVDALGGIVLIGLGVKILLDHLRGG